MPDREEAAKYVTDLFIEEDIRMPGWALEETIEGYWRSTMEIRLESYTYNFDRGGSITWDIGLAKRWVKTQLAKGLPIIEVKIDLEEMAKMIARATINAEHLSNVDPDSPGIGTPIIIDDGSIAYVLIDGHHRCARSLQENKPYNVYLLSDSASQSCIIRSSGINLVP